MVFGAEQVNLIHPENSNDHFKQFFMMNRFFIYKIFQWSFISFLLPIELRAQAVQPKLDSPAQNILLADPSVLLYKNFYYLYGTASPADEGFPVFRSSDLMTWTGPAGAKNGFAIKKGDSYGSKGFWAPQAFAYRNKFYMAYTANEHIAIATSDKPEGPFKQNNLRCLDSNTRQIDPCIFIDDDGKKYLYYVRVANGGNRIFVAELNEDLLSVKKQTEKLCIEATDPWETADSNFSRWTVTEGPSVIKHNHVYYLIYSANDFRSPYYAVGYATSQSPLGPWKKSDENPMIRTEITGHNGRGHGDFVKGKNGAWFYVFHTHYSANQVQPRKTALMELRFVADPQSDFDKLIVQPGTFHYLFYNH